MWQQLTGFAEGIYFLHPGWLWAWFGSSAVIWLLLRYSHLFPLANVPRIFSLQQYRHPRIDILRQLNTTRTQQQAIYRPVRRWLSYSIVLFGLHLALAHPYRLGQQLPNPPEYRDTVFIVDASISMLLRDYLVDNKRVDRMTMMKSVLTLFVNQLEGNRISLIAFSEQAYTLVPLTDDYKLLKTMLRRLEPAVLTGRTSHPGKAMLYALQQLRQTVADSAHKPVLVLVSDVNRPDRELDPAVVAKYIRQQGYRIHTIGIGASSYAAQENKFSGLIFHPANFSILEAIAENGQGKFYWADNARSLQAAMQAIQLGERHKIDATPRFIPLPLYQWPLLITISMIICLQLWPARLFKR